MKPRDEPSRPSTGVLDSCNKKWPEALGPDTTSKPHGDGGGGEMHSVDVQEGNESKPQPVSQHPANSDSVHNRPPCAAHSLVATPNDASEQSEVELQSAVSGALPPHPLTQIDSRQLPSSLQQRMAAVPSGSDTHCCSCGVEHRADAK